MSHNPLHIFESFAFALLQGRNGADGGAGPDGNGAVVGHKPHRTLDTLPTLNSLLAPQGRNGADGGARPDGDGAVVGHKPRFHTTSVRDPLRAIVERLAQPGE